MKPSAILHFVSNSKQNFINLFECYSTISGNALSPLRGLKESNARIIGALLTQ